MSFFKWAAVGSSIKYHQQAGPGSLSIATRELVLAPLLYKTAKMVLTFSFEILCFGATLQDFFAEEFNIVLGFPREEDYVKFNTPHFGATVGRVANRVANAKLCDVNGKDYQLEKNDGENHVHGGSQGFSKKVFESSYKVERNGQYVAMMRLVSPDGDQGYPGTLELKVYYSGRKEDNQRKSCLEIEYEARLIGDECNETVVNLTNHSCGPPFPPFPLPILRVPSMHDLLIVLLTWLSLSTQILQSLRYPNH